MAVIAQLVMPSFLIAIISLQPVTPPFWLSSGRMPSGHVQKAPFHKSMHTSGSGHCAGSVYLASIAATTHLHVLRLACRHEIGAVIVNGDILDVFHFDERGTVRLVEWH